MLLRTPCLLTAASRRSDLEILSYCMVQWLCGRLPWEDKLQDPLYVRDAKIRYVKHPAWALPSAALCHLYSSHRLMCIKESCNVFTSRSQENITEFMAKCFSSQDKPGETHSGGSVAAMDQR